MADPLTDAAAKTAGTGAVMTGLAGAMPYAAAGAMALQLGATGIAALKDAALKKKNKKQQALLAANQGGMDQRAYSEAQGLIQSRQQQALAQLVNRGGVQAGGPTGGQAQALGQVLKAAGTATNEAASAATQVKAQADAQKQARIDQELADIRARGAGRLSSLAGIVGSGATDVASSSAWAQKAQEERLKKLQLASSIQKQAAIV
jgi:hypothetical protein